MKEANGVLGIVQFAASGSGSKQDKNAGVVVYPLP